MPGILFTYGWEPVPIYRIRKNKRKYIIDDFNYERNDIISYGWSIFKQPKYKSCILSCFTTKYLHMKGFFFNFSFIQYCIWYVAVFHDCKIRVELLKNWLKYKQNRKEWRGELMGDFLELNLKHFCIWGQNYFLSIWGNNKKHSYCKFRNS